MRVGPHRTCVGSQIAAHRRKQRSRDEENCHFHCVGFLNFFQAQLFQRNSQKTNVGEIQAVGGARIG